MKKTKVKVDTPYKNSHADLMARKRIIFHTPLDHTVVVSTFTVKLKDLRNTL